MAIKICPECGGKVSTSRDECIHCGYVFPKEKRCPDCGESCPLETKECPGCGYLFVDDGKADSETNVQQKGDGQSGFRVSGGVLLSYSGSEAEVRVPDGVASIGSAAFKGNLAVRKVAFPESVVSIGDEAFYGCVNLKELDNYSNVASFGRSAFEGAGLVEVEIGPAVVSIGESCFSNMRSLERLVYKPNKVLRLKNAFSDCPKLSDVEMDQEYFFFSKWESGRAQRPKKDNRPTIGDAFRRTAFMDKFGSDVNDYICPKCGARLTPTPAGRKCSSCGIYFQKDRYWSHREDKKQGEETEHAPSSNNAPNGENPSSKSESPSCPYCHGEELMEIGKGYYLCLACKMRFLDAQGAFVGVTESPDYAPQAAIELSNPNENDVPAKAEASPAKHVETDEEKYAKAISLKEAKDFASAERAFVSLGGFKDSASQAEECRRLVKEAADEQTYQEALALAAKKGSAAEMLEAYEEAIEKLGGIPEYKDADKLKGEYEEKIKLLREEVARKKAAFCKKAKRIVIASSASVALVVAVLLTTFLYIVPESRQNSIIEALDAKNYSAAWSQICANGNYGDNVNLAHMLSAGEYFDEGDYEEGIDYVVRAGGDVDVDYDADGGTCRRSENIRSAKHVNNDPNKTGYTFSGWSLTSYFLNSRVHHASLNLKATYDIDTYSITYVLNGGANNSLNPTSYTVESLDIALLPATREGYTFLGWSDGSTIISTIEIGSYGNLTLTAQWSAISYEISYDLQGGTIEGEKDSYTVEESVILPDPTRAGYTFLGWTGSNGSLPQKGYKQPEGSYGDRTYKANWEAIDYSITYVLNGDNYMN